MEMEGTISDIDAVTQVYIEKQLEENRDCATLLEEHLELAFRFFNAKRAIQHPDMAAYPFRELFYLYI
jgi:hypothetical protein